MAVGARVEATSLTETIPAEQGPTLESIVEPHGVSTTSTEFEHVQVPNWNGGKLILSLVVEKGLIARDLAWIDGLISTVDSDDGGNDWGLQGMIYSVYLSVNFLEQRDG